MATEYKTTGYPEDIRPFPHPLDMEQGRTPYTSLAEIIHSRPAPFWQEVHQRATLSVNKLQNSFENPDSFETQLAKDVALAIRALDYGMVDLSVTRRLAYLYGYVFEYFNDKQAGANTKLDFDTYLETYFPADRTGSLRDSWIKENGRYQRFKGYVQALGEIQAAGRPDILLSNNRSNSGIYSEFDYWVESQIGNASTKLQVASTKELAQKIPMEFTTYAAMPMKERIYWIHYTRQKLTQTYGRLQPVLPTIREKQFHRLKAFLVPTDTGYQLAVPLEEVSQQLGLTHTNIHALLARVRNTEHISIDIPREKVIHKETILYAHHIIEALAALESAFQTKWGDGQIKIEDIAMYITQKYPELGKTTRQTVKYIIHAYLEPGTIQHPELPIRKLEKKRPERTRCRS